MECTVFVSVDTKFYHSLVADLHRNRGKSFLGFKKNVIKSNGGIGWKSWPIFRNSLYVYKSP